MDILRIVFLLVLSWTWCVTANLSAKANVSTSKTIIWGPGLKTDFRVPVRYFFIQVVFKNGENATESVGEKAFAIAIRPASGERARIWVQVLDRHDGTYIVRYRPYSSVRDLVILVKINGQNVAQSPYTLPGMMYHEGCNCPMRSSEQWARAVGCPATPTQVDSDLVPFPTIDATEMAKKAVKKFSERGRHSICHYLLRSNRVYRKCYGEHVGFKMFTDAILLSLTRKMVLPDTEFIMNLGDWPLEQRSSAYPLPIVSWCGSEDSYDIVLPTYDLTEATLEMMGRVSLDIFSTQANTGPRWENKTNAAFWRGRDSRKERLELVQLSRKYPNLVDAALTNMFFFPKDETKYGPLKKPVSFFDFFKWKYQLNIDGTVAAYRFPYLLAGDSVVFKQDSGYYEHFYRELQPFVHYIPVQHDLADLLDKVKWARDNDQEVRKIAKNGQEYARSNLNPVDVLCYHMRFFQEYSKRLKNKTSKLDGFELVEEKNEPCDCDNSPPIKSNTGREEL